MANALDDVRDTFTTLNAQYKLLLAACHPGTEEKADLQAKYALAEQNFEACADKALEDDDDQVKTISTQLQATNKQVAQATKEMGNMQKVIGDIATAVNYGSQLLAMV